MLSHKKIFIVIMLLHSAIALAQHSIDVQRLAAQGQHFEALVQFEKMAKRQSNIEAIIASGKSAWALGLHEQATKAFEEVLRSVDLSNDSRARLLLSRGVIEFQEQRYQVAALFAERAIKASPTANSLKAKGYLLWGESLYASGAHALALERYQQALAEKSADVFADASFMIGRCLVRLGRYKDAIPHLEALPVNHDRTPESIRLLAFATLETEQYDQVEFWLERGRESYSENFLDSWVDYAIITTALHKGDLKRATELLKAAEQKYPPADDWLILAQATVESSLWQAKASVKEGSK